MAKDPLGLHEGDPGVGQARPERDSERVEIDDVAVRIPRVDLRVPLLVEQRLAVLAKYEFRDPGGKEVTAVGVFVRHPLAREDEVRRFLALPCVARSLEDRDDRPREGDRLLASSLRALRGDRQHGRLRVEVEVRPANPRHLAATSARPDGDRVDERPMLAAEPERLASLVGEVVPVALRVCEGTPPCGLNEGRRLLDREGPTDAATVGRYVQATKAAERIVRGPPSLDEPATECPKALRSRVDRASRTPRHARLFQPAGRRREVEIPDVLRPDGDDAAVEVGKRLLDVASRDSPRLHRHLESLDVVGDRPRAVDRVRIDEPRGLAPEPLDDLRPRELRVRLERRSEVLTLPRPVLAEICPPRRRARRRPYAGCGVRLRPRGAVETDEGIGLAFTLATHSVLPSATSRSTRLRTV